MLDSGNVGGTVSCGDSVLDSGNVGGTVSCGDSVLDSGNVGGLCHVGTQCWTQVMLVDCVLWALR